MDFPTSLRLTLTHAGAGHFSRTVEDLRAAGVPDLAMLAAYKTVLSVEVDAAAERLRLSLTTPGAGQAMEYVEARAQAMAALAAPGQATAERFPMLAASIGLDVDPETGAGASDVLGVARAVMGAYHAWMTAGAAIRAARLSGKAAIAASPDPLAAATAAAAITWPALPG